MSIDVHKGQRASVTDKKLLTSLGVDSSKVITIDVDYDKAAYANHADLWIIPQEDTHPKIVLTNQN